MDQITTDDVSTSVNVSKTGIGNIRIDEVGTGHFWTTSPVGFNYGWELQSPHAHNIRTVEFQGGMVMTTSSAASTCRSAPSVVVGMMSSGVAAKPIHWLAETATIP